jgi:hypothetical protein
VPGTGADFCVSDGGAVQARREGLATSKKLKSDSGNLSFTQRPTAVKMDPKAASCGIL